MDYLHGITSRHKQNEETHDSESFFSSICSNAAFLMLGIVISHPNKPLMSAEHVNVYVAVTVHQVSV